MIIINPREVAAQALMEIVRDEAYNNAALRKILKQNGAMSVQDRAFVTEIVNGTLRNITFIDMVIDQFSTVKAEKLKPFVAAVLRAGVYQIGFMDKVPESAVVNEAVALVKEKGFGKLSGFVNGVLRSIIRGWNEICLPDEKEEPVRYLELKYSYPQWLLKMWLHEYSYDFVKALCEKNNESPDVTIACNTLKLTVEQLEKELETKGVNVRRASFIENALHVSGTANIAALDAFQKGYFHVQDESSMLAARVLSPEEGESVLDICAAPGGKSVLMAQMMKNKGIIIARDVYGHKLELLKETADRLGIDIIDTQEKDATILYEKSVNAFDKVLADVPCTGLGLIRKKPDIKRKKTGDDIDALCKIQKQILACAAKYVKKDGILVYSTCTICKKENSKNIEWFLDNFDFELCDMNEYLPETLGGGEDGMLQLFPHIHDTDGFFIARLKRKG